jgi:hypothetical protein
MSLFMWTETQAEPPAPMMFGAGGAGGFVCLCDH